MALPSWPAGCCLHRLALVLVLIEVPGELGVRLVFFTCVVDRPRDDLVLVRDLALRLLVHDVAVASWKLHLWSAICILRRSRTY